MRTDKKAIILGANGIIGNALFHALPQAGFTCTGLTSQAATAFTPVTYTWPALRSHVADADTVLYCIGISKFAECEEEPETSHYLNCELPCEIQRNLSAQQSFVYLSSPIAIYDFAGATPNQYALQKRAAEAQLMAAAHPRTLIVRPSKVIESLGILGTWRAQLQQGQSISAFSDQYLAPIPRRLLAQQIGALLLGGHAGCYNFSAADRMSYDAIAQALCDHLAADPAQVIATRARDQNPFFFQQDVLDCSAAAKATGYAPPLARDIIFDYIRKLP